MDLLSTLFYGVCLMVTLAVLIKMTEPLRNFIEEDELPEWVNMPPDLAQLELNEVLIQAIDNRVDRVRKLDDDSLEFLKRDMILIAMAYSEGCVRHSENRLN